MPVIAERAAPVVFDWKRWPDTDAFVDELIESALEGNAFAAEPGGPDAARDRDEVQGLGRSPRGSRRARPRPIAWKRWATSASRRRTPWACPSSLMPAGSFPGSLWRRLRRSQNGAAGLVVSEVAIKVERVGGFFASPRSGAGDRRAIPMGPYRVGRVPGERTTLAVVERRGYLGFEPFPGELAREGRMKPHAARDALAARDLWQARRRRFDDDEEGIAATEACLERVIELAGSTDLACHLVFEVERDYWQSRNAAARAQKARQDRLGLGWANHDHHTFRCSRRFFPRVIGMFTRLGFELRERFHAGEHAGWGAQIVEHPVTGIVIFADLDLAPEEATEDFAHVSLPDLPRPGTVGLWVALHGESILEAGMHHLEAQFDFDALRDGLKSESGIETMAPFSNFPFLRQAFTAGERWPVARHRADRALCARLDQRRAA